MITAQSAIGPGLVKTAFTEVWTALIAPTSRSSSSGNEITLMQNTVAANKKPMACPRPRVRVVIEHAGHPPLGQPTQVLDVHDGRRRHLGSPASKADGKCAPRSDAVRTGLPVNQ